MSADFEPVLVKDSKLMLTDKLDYPVVQGASDNTYQTFKSNTASSSSITFNVMTPSESVAVSRLVYIESDIYFTVNLTERTQGAAAAGAPLFNYGNRDALAPFPLQQCFSNAQVSINNTSSSVNVQDILNEVLSCMSNEEMSKYCGHGTPTYKDNYGLFSDAVDANNNPLGGYRNASHCSVLPRGTHELIDFIPVITPTAGGAPSNSVLAIAAKANYNFHCHVKVREPLFLPPFLFCDSKYRNASIMGIGSMSYVFNIDSSLKRLFSYGTDLTLANPGIPGALSITPGWIGNDTPQLATKVPSHDLFENCNLLFNFLTPSSVDLQPSKCITPYVKWQRYITGSNNTTSIPANSSAPYTISNIQLNTVPNKFYICARKPMSQKTIQDPNVWYGIEKVNITFSNKSGILSGATQYDLWKISNMSGSVQSFQDFQGVAQAYAGPTVAVPNRKIPTQGAVLTINPALFMSLDPQLSNGSLGNFNFQMDITIRNNYSTAQNVELVVIVQQDGLLKTISGSSSTDVGLLNKQLVLDTMTSGDNKPISSTMLNTMSGGNVNDQVASAMKNLQIKGSARSGGARSGGARSGGMSKVHHNKLDALVL